MVLKAIKNSLKKNCQEKHFFQKKKSMKKTNLDKNIFPEIFQSQKFSEVPKFGYFLKVV